MAAVRSRLAICVRNFIRLVHSEAAAWEDLPIVHVKATANNTMCTLSDKQGLLLLPIRILCVCVCVCACTST